jgi:hypothetical protein
MTMRRFSARLAILAGLVLLLAIPAFAGDAVITNGIDLWVTPATGGGTFYDFSKDPLPAGFFCSSGAPFTGKIVFKGAPVLTNPANALRGADTIIQRLDDAAFAKSLPAITPFAIRGVDGIERKVGPAFFRGREVAVTRLQVKALSFVGVSPVETGCGAYTVRTTLVGEQPVTQMVIVRETENGGTFYAPLALNARLIFTPVGGGTPIEAMRSIRFAAKPLSVWTDVPGKRASVGGFVAVDTDGNGRADVMLPGTSNFAAGFKGGPPATRGGLPTKVPYGSPPYCGGTGVNYNPTDCHATTPPAGDP